MKQIEEMFERFIAGKKPLKKKWQMRYEPMSMLKSSSPEKGIDVDVIKFWHYHHLILLFDISNRKEGFSFYERQADERGYDSIRQWLSNEDNFERLVKRIEEIKDPIKAIAQEELS